MDSPRCVSSRSVPISTIVPASKSERIGPQMKCFFFFNEGSGRMNIINLYFNEDMKEDCKNYVKVPCPMLRDFQKSIAFLKIPRLRPFVLLVKETYRWICVWSIWWNDTDREAKVFWRVTCPSATLYTRNRTWTDLGSNTSLCGEMPATDRLSCGRTLL
jgi:hypothetical protein